MNQSTELIVEKTDTPNSRSIAEFSHWMAQLTVILAVVIVLLNVMLWVFPELLPSGMERLSFSTWASRLCSDLGVDVSSLPWWQRLGGMALIGFPLATVVWGAVHLYRLFQLYSREFYFSSHSATHLGKVGCAAMLWVVVSFFCEPILALWLTMAAPKGERAITLSFHGGDMEMLFLAGSIVVIAHILRKASEVNEENQSFI